MTFQRAALARLAVPAAALCLCAVTDPLLPSPWVVCPFRLVTGLPCPMCGLTRGVASVLRGEWTAALSYHWLSPLAALSLGAWIAIDAGHALRLWDLRDQSRRLARPAPLWTAFSLCFVYGALRWWGIIGSPHT